MDGLTTTHGPIAKTFLRLASLLVLGCPMASAAPGDPLDRTRLRPTFSEEFSGPLDLYDRRRGTGRWKTAFDFGDQTRGPSSRTLGAELQVYSDPAYNGVQPFRSEDGELVIAADRNPKPAHPVSGGKPYTSGLLTTSPSFRQRYGYFEMRARLPAGAGLWPAFWLNAPFDPAITAPQFQGEIDVMEMLGKAPHTIYCSAHWPRDATRLTQDWKIQEVAVGPTDVPRTYGVLWSREALVWYVNDREVARMRNPDLHGEMFILVNLAVGGEWGGPPDERTRFPAEMRIDFIRAYQIEPAGR